MQDTHTRALAVVAVALVGLLASWTVLGAGVVAQNATNASDKAPMYENNSTTVANQSWLQNSSEPTLANTTGLLTRIGTFFVGSGVRGQNVWAGPIVLALIVGGAAIGAAAGSAGIVAGAVVAFAVVGMLVEVGLVPTWIWPVALFGLGLVVTAVYIRLNR